MEAMAYGLPVVSMTEFAVPELIEVGIGGFVIKKPIFRLYWWIKSFWSITRERTPQFPLLSNPSEEYVNKLIEAVEKFNIDRNSWLMIGEHNTKLIKN